MAGSGVKLTVRDTEANRALDGLRGAGPELQKACLKNIGEALLKSHYKRFAAEKAPDGTPWKPLNPEYEKGKRGTKIMQESGMQGGLLGSLHYQVSGGQLEFGTNKIYARAQHYGATIVPKSGDFLVFRINGRLVHARKVVLPARPIIGISASDRTMMKEIVDDHLAEDWNGR